MRSLAGLFGLCLWGIMLSPLACTQESQSVATDAVEVKVAKPAPKTIIKPEQKLVDEDLNIILSGTSHPSHIGQQRSRELFQRIKNWPKLYEARLKPVYRNMVKNKQSPGSHVDFCIGIIARGDEETVKRLSKLIDH